MQLIPAKIASKCKGNYFQDVNNDQKRVNYRFSFTIWSFVVRSKVERKPFLGYGFISGINHSRNRSNCLKIIHNRQNDLFLCGIENFAKDNF